MPLMPPPWRCATLPGSRPLYPAAVTAQAVRLIGSLRGRLLDRGPDGELLIEVGGVGHRVQVAVHLGHDRRTRRRCGTRTTPFERFRNLAGHTAERRSSQSLISAHGVGPALGLAILSVHGPDASRRRWGRCRCALPRPRRREEDGGSARDGAEVKLDLPGQDRGPPGTAARRRRWRLRADVRTSKVATAPTSSCRAGRPARRGRCGRVAQGCASSACLGGVIRAVAAATRNSAAPRRTPLTGRSARGCQPAARRTGLRPRPCRSSSASPS